MGHCFSVRRKCLHSSFGDFYAFRSAEVKTEGRTKNIKNLNRNNNSKVAKAQSNKNRRNMYRLKIRQTKSKPRRSNHEIDQTAPHSRTLVVLLSFCSECTCMELWRQTRGENTAQSRSVSAATRLLVSIMHPNAAKVAKNEK